MDRIKKLKVKKADGNFTDYIPIGSDAQYIDMEDGDNVESSLSRIKSGYAHYYDDISAMKNDTKLKEGDICQTLGYYSPNDNGAGIYKIINNNSLIDDGGNIHNLSNGLKAELIIKNGEVNIKQFGAYGDGEHDDTKSFKNIFKSNLKYKLIMLPIGNYKITEPLEIPGNIIFQGQGGDWDSVKISAIGCDIIHLTNDSRFTTIQNISLRGDKNCACIAFKYIGNGGKTATRITIKNITFAHAKYGITDSFINGQELNISNKLTFWDITFDNISYYYGTNQSECYGLYINQPATGFAVKFTNFVSGDTKIYLNNINCIMDCCNFGFAQNTFFKTGPSFKGLFNACNFECDEDIKEGSIIQLNSTAIEFTNCTFTSRLLDSAVTFFDFGSSIRSLIFTNNHFRELNAKEKWLNPIGTGVDSYGAIKFLGYNNINFEDFNGSVYVTTNFRHFGESFPIASASTLTSSIPLNAIAIYKNKISRWDGNKWVDANGEDIV